ncbi:hypothetical protein [Methylobrevis pamukkalensis]|uniref:hypothetical protein n=1 Tax=Methylobrevis pamukkalensis TaxID=1439726 RepID=UPI0009F37265|nr:hypothetical protein [Methylobrevis pamukkalensis]
MAAARHGEDEDRQKRLLAGIADLEARTIAALDKARPISPARRPRPSPGWRPSATRPPTRSPAPPPNSTG